MNSWEDFAALLVFAHAATWTPGPNNLLLLNSGIRFGFLRTVPHALGVSLGFAAMLFCIAMGLGELFENQPRFRQGLALAGAAAMSWICWRIIFLPFPGDPDDPTERYSVGGRPWNFWQAAAFQWINPKAWALCIAALSAYVKGDNLFAEALFCSLAFTISGVTSAHGWALFGKLIRRFLNTPPRFRAYTVFMGTAMGISGVFLFLNW